VVAIAVAAAVVVADPLLRRLAAGLPEHRWLGPPLDPPVVLGVVTGAVAAVLVARADPAALALPGAGLAPVVALASAIDLRRHRLPDRLTMPSAAGLAVLAAVAALVERDAAIAVRAAVGAVVFAGLLLVVHLASPAGMGFGDVKLGVPLGLAVGATSVAAVLVALVAGTAIGAVAGLAVLARHRDRRHAFAFGPYLCAGAVLALVVH
jgi:leader peptidase (prepilin peptidase)/N-methyltransferase